jgi:putative nucleotidyltransferase with HDIG domain
MFQKLFRLRLQWKIWLLSVAAIMGLAFSTSMIVNYMIKTILSPLIEDELKARQNSVHFDLTRKTDDLYRLCKELAQSPRLKGCLSTSSDRNSVVNVANEMLSLAPCDLMVITSGEDNEVRYTYGKDVNKSIFEYVGGMVSLQQAQNGDSSLDVWRFGEKTYVVVSVPVSSLSGILGTLTLGYEFSNPQIAQQLENHHKVEIAFLTRNQLVSSSLNSEFQNDFSKLIQRNPIEQQKGVMERKLNRTAPEIITLGKEKFLMIPSILYPGPSSELDSVVFLSLEKFLEFPRRVEWALSIVSLVLSCLAIVFSYYITKTISAPREQLVDTMSKITHSGDLTQRISIHSSDTEMRSLTESFNTMVESLEKSQREKEDSYASAIRAVMVALDARDSETYGHSERVVRYTMAIAKKMNVPQMDLQSIRWGALLHDVGKIGIADAILRKPGPLTLEEREAMKQHPMMGHKMLEGIQFLNKAVPLVLHHHEKYDGKGYPVGIKGEEIFLGARIFAVADVYDALTSHRPYRESVSYEEAVEEIIKGRGTHFDSQVVDAFLQIPKDEWLKLKESVT